MMKDMVDDFIGWVMDSGKPHDSDEYGDPNKKQGDR